MDVFVIPVGPSKYELYCEDTAEPDANPVPPVGIIGRLRYRFSVMLRAAEERRHRPRDVEAQVPSGRWERIQERIMAWVAERIAEQRLLWNLRRQTAAVAAHPYDMSVEQVQTLIRRTLQRDYERHRVWLVVDSLGLIVSLALILLPGPNVIGYYFAFRVVGHWLSMRGAVQGIRVIAWSYRPCPPLDELREAAALEPDSRAARVDDVAARLRLRHLASFFERVAVRHA